MEPCRRSLIGMLSYGTLPEVSDKDDVMGSCRGAISCMGQGYHPEAISQFPGGGRLGAPPLGLLGHAPPVALVLFSGSSLILVCCFNCAKEKLCMHVHEVEHLCVTCICSYTSSGQFTVPVVEASYFSRTVLITRLPSIIATSLSTCLTLAKCARILHCVHIYLTAFPLFN